MGVLRAEEEKTIVGRVDRTAEGNETFAEPTLLAPFRFIYLLRFFLFFRFLSSFECWSPLARLHLVFPPRVAPLLLPSPFRDFSPSICGLRAGVRHAYVSLEGDPGGSRKKTPRRKRDVVERRKNEHRERAGEKEREREREVGKREGGKHTHIYLCKRNTHPANCAVAHPQ